MKYLYIIIAVLALTACGSKDSASRSHDSTDSMSSHSIEATIHDSGMPTVIDFYATWCGPCKTIRPVFEQLEKKYGSHINFVTVDVDENPEIAVRYSVEAMPTFIFLDKDGNEVNRLIGANPDGLVSMVLDLQQLDSEF